jgi:hypothetical protein
MIRIRKLDTAYESTSTRDERISPFASDGCFDIADELGLPQR